MAERFCGECGAAAPVRFDGETFTIEHVGLMTEVMGLAGWRCSACGEIEFDTDSARRYAAAGDELVLRARETERVEIRRIRRKLGLSQSTAARLTGGVRRLPRCRQDHRPAMGTGPQETQRPRCQTA